MRGREGGEGEGGRGRGKGGREEEGREGGEEGSRPLPCPFISELTMLRAL